MLKNKNNNRTKKVPKRNKNTKKTLKQIATTRRQLNRLKQETRSLRSQVPVAIKVNKRAPLSNGRTVRLRHTEYLASLSLTPSDYELSTNISVQPGFNIPFQWLAPIANNYEKYRINSIQIEYKPSCATTTPGHVWIVYDPDVYDQPPSSMQEVLQYKYHLYGSVFSPHRMNLSSSIFKQLFVRSFQQPVVGDLKTYDSGQFFIGYSASSATLTAGFFSIAYDVTLYDPQPNLYSDLATFCRGNYKSGIADIYLNGAPQAFNTDAT
jgi:hypothetical protein